MTEARKAWLSLGSNLGDREAMLAAAIRALRRRPDIAVEAVSSLYETPPWGDLDQGPFLNAAVAVATSLAPETLLGVAKTIEADLGRSETRRWGPRLIDIDIIHMAGTAWSGAGLTLPHPHWRERGFVLLPLAEIAPELVIDQMAVTAALADADLAGITKREGGAAWAG